MKFAFNYKLVYFKLKRPDLYSKLNVRSIEILMLPFLVHALKPDPNTNPKLLKQCLTQLQRKTKKSLKSLLFAFSGPLEMKIEILTMLYHYMTFFTFKFVYEDIFEYFSLYLHGFNPKTKGLVFEFIIRVMEGLRTKNHLTIVDNLKTQNDNSFIFFVDGNTKVETIEKMIEFYSQSIKDDSTEMEKINSLDYFIGYNIKKNKFECIETICRSVRKFIPISIFEVEDFNIVNRIAQVVLSFKTTEIQQMSLDTFIQVSKLFIFLLEIIIAIDKRNHKSKIKLANFDEFIYEYISFCLDYFAEDRHLAFKSTTIHSIKNINEHKRIIYDLIFIYKKLKSSLSSSKIISDKLQISKIEKRSFYNKVNLNTSSSLKNMTSYKIIKSNCVPDYLPDNLKSSGLIKAILWFIKEKVDLLRSVIYTEFKGVTIDIFKDKVNIQQKDAGLLVDLFRVNPNTAFNLFKK